MFGNMLRKIRSGGARLLSTPVYSSPWCGVRGDATDCSMAVDTIGPNHGPWRPTRETISLLYVSLVRCGLTVVALEIGTHAEAVSRRCVDLWQATAKNLNMLMLVSA